jgi:hypothetical protein
MSADVAGGSQAGRDRAASDARRLIAARLCASAVHLAISATVALLLVMVVTQVWYPSPFFGLDNGRDIFLLMIGCDITLGPLLTLIVFNIRKPRAALVRDLAIIGTVQLAALLYGVSALLKVRPAYIVYNVGRFNVPVANELVAGTEEGASAKSVGAPWFGPVLVGALLPPQTEERNRLLFSAVGGRGDVFQMPRYFVPYAEVKSDVAAHARSADALARDLQLDPARVRAAVAGYASRGASVGYLPLVIRQTMAVAVVSLPDGAFLGIAPLPPPLSM